MGDDVLRVPEYLGHIREAIRRIRRYTAALDKAAFLADERTQDAVIRNIEVIGEAARNIARHHPGFAAEQADVPWDDIYFMRNRLAHGYASVDLELVWKVVERDVPELEAQIERLQARTVSDRS